jgi:23S rRNA U2552 (ribose-2'-O)-methylase RlmE/FtsJ
MADISPRWIPGGPHSHYMRYDLKFTKIKDEQKGHFSAALTPILMTLHRLKNRIDDMDHQNTWDEYKKITNPYEFVFLSLARRMQYSVAKKIPLSRSYYKMIEIWQSLNLAESIPAIFVTAHSAEGPGGFIEAIIDIAAKKDYTLQGSLAMTLRSTDKNIPGWKKSQAFLHKNPGVEITYGKDNTGNLYNLENHTTFKEILAQKSQSGKAHLYTADGGFDFTNDFNNQEENVIQLLLAEILLGLTVLEKGGVLIIKFFDTVLQPTLEMLYITTRHFREWTITKPKTSRAANSERYLVCRGFLGPQEDAIRIFSKALLPSKTTGGKNILSFLDTTTHKEQEYLEFEKEIMFFQELFSKCQIEAIKRTLTIIETKTTAMLQAQINENISRSIEWCTQHDIEINEFYKDNTPETQLAILTTELLTVGSLLPSRTRSDTTPQPFPSRRYLQEQFQPQLRIDAVSVPPTPSSQTVQSISGELLDYNRALESWQTTEETRSGNWEIVRRQQRGAWKGVPQ